MGCIQCSLEWICAPIGILNKRVFHQHSIHPTLNNITEECKLTFTVIHLACSQLVLLAELNTLPHLLYGTFVYCYCHFNGVLPVTVESFGSIVHDTQQVVAYIWYVRPFLLTQSSEVVIRIFFDVFTNNSNVKVPVPS